MEITEQDYELLSAYLDGALDEPERVALETRLASEEYLRQELNALRQTVALVKTLPTMKAPRSFALTAEMAGKRADGDGDGGSSTPPARGRIVNFVLPVLSAAASLMLVLFGLTLLLSNNALPNATRSFAPPSSSEVASFASPTIDLTAVERAAVAAMTTMTAVTDGAGNAADSAITDAMTEEAEASTMMQEADEAIASDEAQEEMDTMSAAAPDAAMLLTEESAAGAMIVPDQTGTFVFPAGSPQVQTTLLYDAAPSLTGTQPALTGTLTLQPTRFPFTPPPAAGGEGDAAAQSRLMPTMTLLPTMKSTDDLFSAQGNLTESGAADGETAGTAVVQQITPLPSPASETPPADATATTPDAATLIGIGALVIGTLLTLLSLRSLIQRMRRA